MPVEWGLRVGVSEDQYGFILSHRVMPQETDDPVAIPVVTERAQRFPNRHSVSLDQGFHRPAHQERRAERVPLPVLPQQGKGNATAARREADPECRRLRRQHAAVASAINALATPGLDRCPDHVRIPRQLDTDSSASWTPVPRQPGPSERSDARGGCCLRWGGFLRQSGLEFAQGCPGEVEGVGVVDQAVEDSVGQGRITQGVVPVGHR